MFRTLEIYFLNTYINFLEFLNYICILKESVMSCDERLVNFMQLIAFRILITWSFASPY